MFKYMYTGPTTLRDLRTTEQLKCLAQGHKKLTQIFGTSQARTHTGQSFMYSESDALSTAPRFPQQIIKNKVTPNDS